MVKNQEFTDQLQRLVGEIPQKVSVSMSAIQSSSSQINAKIEKIGTELQYLMQQMNKSSLFKTTVALSTKMQSCYDRIESKSVDVEVSDTLTFNHKGIGSMQVSDNVNAQPYGSTYSNPLRIRKMLEVISNKNIHQQILMDLAVNGKKNAMPIWVETMKIHEECLALLELGDRHKEDIIFTLEKPVIVKVPELEDNVVTMKPLCISKIKFDNYSALTLFQDSSTDSKRLSVTSLEDYLVFIQFSEELYDIMDQCNRELDIEQDKVDKHIDMIKTKLATHFVTLEMNENFEATQESYHW